MRERTWRKVRCITKTPEMQNLKKRGLGGLTTLVVRLWVKMSVSKGPGFWTNVLNIKVMLRYTSRSVQARDVHNGKMHLWEVLWQVTCPGEKTQHKHSKQASKAQCTAEKIQQKCICVLIAIFFFSTKEIDTIVVDLGNVHIFSYCHRFRGAFFKHFQNTGPGLCQ